jgi:hypothetical protein
VHHFNSRSERPEFNNLKNMVPATGFEPVAP